MNFSVKQKSVVENCLKGIHLCHCKNIYTQSLMFAKNWKH